MRTLIARSDQLARAPASADSAVAKNAPVANGLEHPVTVSQRRMSELLNSSARVRATALWSVQLNRGAVERPAPRPVQRVRVNGVHQGVQYLAADLDTEDLDAFKLAIDQIGERDPSPIVTLTYVISELRRAAAAGANVAAALEYVRATRAGVPRPADRPSAAAAAAPHADVPMLPSPEDEAIEQLLEFPEFENLVRDVRIRDEQIRPLVIHARELMETMYRSLVSARTTRAAPEDQLAMLSSRARQIVAIVTEQAMNILRGLHQAPLQPIAVIAGGSFARSEVFPQSDLDYGILGSDAEEAAVHRVLYLMNHKLHVARALLARRLGLSPDQAVHVGFAADVGPLVGRSVEPRNVAAKSLGQQNTGQDATLVPTAVGSVADQERLFGAFQTARGQPGRARGRAELRARLGEFWPLREIAGVVDIKSQMLRLLTLSVRDLSTVFVLSQSSTLGRLRELVERDLLDAGLETNLERAYHILAAIRLRLHNAYGYEKDTASVGPREGQIELTVEEIADLRFVHLTLARFHAVLESFAASDNPGDLGASMLARARYAAGW